MKCVTLENGENRKGVFTYDKSRKQQFAAKNMFD